MRTIACLLALFLANSSWAADLTKIDRGIHHEPIFQSKTPKYCLLVFGPDVETKVWLVLDGKTLYVDEKGKGDLRDAKRVKLSEVSRTWFKAGSIKISDNQTDYMSGGDWFYHQKEHWVSIDLQTSDGWKYSARPQFAEQPDKAPVVHFGGPLTMSLGRQAPGILNRGDKLKLAPLLGTQGLGEGTFATVMPAPGATEQNPQANIEFPHAQSGSAPIKISVKFNWDEC